MLQCCVWLLLYRRILHLALPAWLVTTCRDGREKTNGLTNDCIEAAERTQHTTETPFSLQQFQVLPPWLFLPDF